MEDIPAHLMCPACRSGELPPLAKAAANDSLACTCGASYPVREGIPVLLVPEYDAPPEESASNPYNQKRRQADFFDHEADEFEIMRPNGSPALYSWLLGEKFQRSVSTLRPVLSGATVLTVCGGSGMDAEFLAREGARVIVSDISLGAARRARERARRFGLPITAIVADAENLPFPDRSVDLVYVHDGLHHLEQPVLGLAEMARVARLAVSVTEPARAAVTHLAVQLNLALAQEEAGNRVARLTADEVAGQLRASGLRLVNVDRYAMYYRHEPGRIMQSLSRPLPLALATASFRLVNRVAGRFGNKLTVQAVRGASDG